jgi:hypothetical protein
MSIGTLIGGRIGAAPQGLTLAEICRAAGRSGIDGDIVGAIAMLEGNPTPSCSAHVEFVDEVGGAHEVALGVVERAGLGFFFPHPVTGSPVDEPAEHIRLRFEIAEGTALPSTFSTAFDRLSS